jgi:N,N'-diacetyllegionaminate synthase
MIKKLELSEQDHRDLIVFCKEQKIVFLSSPFDLDSLKLLIELGLEVIKIPSGEITNLPLLREIGKSGKKVILSTGMATIEEVKEALEILVNSGTKKKEITVLHCNTEYPTPFTDVNLNAMITLKEELDIQVGYSDHTTGIEVPIAAVALGASVIEKHFTLGRDMEGPDHKASLEPAELKQMVQSIRNIEESLGSGKKEPSKSELKNRSVVRKSIVAAKPINKGEIFTVENLTTKRPGTGISPMLWDDIIGKRASTDYAKDDLIELT